MAVVNFTATRLEEGVLRVVWGPLANGDTGSPFASPKLADKCVQVKGTFGAGGTVKIEGSNDDTSPTYATVESTNNAQASYTAAAIDQIAENPYWLRPNVTAGDGTTALTVTMIVRG